MKFRYTGNLAKPLPNDSQLGTVRTFSGLLNLAAAEMARIDWTTTRRLDASAEANRATTELGERIAALYAAHGVEFLDNDALLFALIDAHVPGLKANKVPRGPRSAWTPKERAKLKIAIDDYVASEAHKRRNVTVSAVCEMFASKAEWESRLGRTRNNRAKSLRWHYDHAEHVHVQLVRDEQTCEAWAAAHPQEAARQRQTHLRALLELHKRRE